MTERHRTPSLSGLALPITVYIYYIESCTIYGTIYPIRLRA